MFNIVIIDDEPLSIRKLKLLLSKSQLPVKTLGTATNGEEGLKLIQELKPNLIFTDIQMPTMDGLQMIQKLRSQNNQTTIIILSCHENFYYAKEAIKLNTYDYLLKDLLDLNSLNSLFARLLIEKPYLPKTTAHLMSSHNLESLFYQTLEDNKPDALQVLERHYATLAPLNLVLFHIKLAFSSPFFNPIFTSFELNQLVQSIKQVLPQTALVTLINQNIVVLDTIDCGSSRLTYYTECQKISQQLVFQLKKEHIKLFMISISAPFQNTAHLYKHFQEIVTNSYNLLPSQMNPVYFVNDTQYTPNMTYEIVDQSLQDIMEMIDNLDIHGIQTTIHDLFNDEENGFIQINYLNYIHICLLTCLKESMDLHKINPTKVFDTKRIPIEEIEKLEQLSEIEAWYLTKLQKIINELSERRLKKYSPKISKSIQIIEQNPSISLTELSDKMNMNKSYLCRLFKKEVAINLTDYTLNVRIEKAKKLLTETNMKVNDISNQLGYIYAHQFSKDFKKVTQIIPTEYRRKY